VSQLNISNLGLQISREWAERG